MSGQGIIECTLETRMIADIEHLAAHPVAERRETRRLSLDARAIDIEERHVRAVFGERCGDGESETAAAAGDDGALAGDAEQLLRLQALLPPAISTTIFMPCCRRNRPMPCSMRPSKGIVSTHPASG